MSIWLLLAAMTLGATDTPAPVDATIAAVGSQPGAFDGKWVRLRGQVDQCTHFDCALCPEDATQATIGKRTCLPIDWDPQRGSREERGADFDPIYRYASVELVARFDQLCWTGGCTDRAPVLMDARVERVLKRRPSALGLNARRAIDRVIDAPKDAAAPLIALLMRSDGVTGREPNPPRYRVFTGQNDPGIVRSAMICRSRGTDDDPATWPLDETSATIGRSTEDRFTCHFASRRNGEWTIPPG